MKTMCNPGAVERFGVMPSQKAKVSEKEAQEVAIWLYERYENERFE
jgi:hypothetical protein